MRTQDAAAAAAGPTFVDAPGVEHEGAFWDAGLPLVAGVDEVGRGALAGPLVAAAVVLPCCGGDDLTRLRETLAAVRDSKLLRPEQRAELVAPVTAVARAVAVGVVEPAELDAVGLAAANRLAMERAVLALAVSPDALLLDACVVDLGLPQVGLIDGDARCLSIAAASIVAKVYRDRLMAALDAGDDRYRFASHKGYGSALHLQRLREHGPGPHHRRCFAPVAACLVPDGDIAAAPTMRTPDPAACLAAGAATVNDREVSDAAAERPTGTGAKRRGRRATVPAAAWLPVGEAPAVGGVPAGPSAGAGELVLPAGPG